MSAQEIADAMFEVENDAESHDEDSMRKQYAEFRAVMHEQREEKYVLDESIRSKVYDSSLDDEGFKWRFNSSVALVINASFLTDDRLLQAYLTKIFTQLGVERVRMDLLEFIETTLAPYLKKSADTIWTSHFQKAKTPGVPKLVQVFPALTKLYDFQKQHFSLRPQDMTLFVTEQKVQLAAMSAVVNKMAAKIEEINTPTLDNLLPSQEQSTKVDSTAEEAKPAAVVTKPPTWSKVVAKSASKKPKQSTKQRPKLVCGTAGKEYSGPKQDKHLKLLVADTLTLDQVKNAIENASGIDFKEIEVELVSTNPRSYSCTYRARIKGLRLDRHRELLKANSWPSGMKVSEWRGAWRPLLKHDKIKIFVGNLHSDMSHDKVQRNVKGIYERAGYSISHVSSEVFIGNRTKNADD